MTINSIIEVYPIDISRQIGEWWSVHPALYGSLLKPTLWKGTSVWRAVGEDSIAQQEAAVI